MNTVLKHHKDSFTLLEFGTEECWTLAWSDNINGKEYGDYIVSIKEPNKKEIEKLSIILKEQRDSIKEEIHE